MECSRQNEAHQIRWLRGACCVPRGTGRGETAGALLDDLVQSLVTVRDVVRSNWALSNGEVYTRAFVRVVMDTGIRRVNW